MSFFISFAAGYTDFGLFSLLIWMINRGSRVRIESKGNREYALDSDDEKQPKIVKSIADWE